MKFWCASAFIGTTELVGLARQLDEHGYHGLMVSDHLMYPRQLGSRYPYSPHPDGRPIWEPETEWPEAWVAIGAMSAVTTRLHFGTNVYITAMRPLLTMAKEIATAAVISGGRVTLGAGAGWMREEFEIQGQDFDTRGRRFSEQIQALRALWQPGWVSFDGEFYQVPEVRIGPTPPGPIPVLVGGQTDAAMRRAARLGDGWIGTQYTWDQAVEVVGRLRRFLDAEGRDPAGFEIVMALYAAPSVELFQRAEAELGVTGVVCMPWAMRQFAGEARTPTMMAEEIARFAESIVAHCS